MLGVQNIDRDNLDYKVLLMLIRLSIVACGIFLLIDLFITHDYISIVIEFVGIVVSWLSLRYVKESGVKNWLIYGYIIFFHIIANLAWFTGGGYSVVNVMVFFLVVFGSALLIKPRYFPFMGVFTLANIFGLYYLQVENPELLASYASIEGPYEEFALVIGPFVVGCVIAVYMRKFYNDETDRIRKQNELLNEHKEEIRQSREQYRILTENGTDIISMHNDLHNVIYVTPSIRNILGYTQEEIYSVDYFELIHPQERRDLYDDMVASVKAQITRSDYHYRLRHADGYFLWMESRVSRSYDEHGRFLQSVVSSTDITQQKNAVEALREEEKRYRLLAENSGDIVTLYNRAMDCEYVSPSVQEVLGFTVEEFDAIESFSRIHPEDVEPLKEFIKGAYQGTEKRYVIRYRYLHKEGHYVWLESLMRPQFNEHYQLVHLVSVARDVTAIVEQQEKIRLSEKRFRKLSEDLKEAQRIARIGNWSMNMAEGTHEWSSTTYDIYGVDESEEAFDIGAKLVHPDDLQRYRDNQHNIKEKGACDCVIRIYRQSDGELRYLNFKGRVSTEQENNSVPKVIGTVQDVTEQKLYEIDIKEKEEFIRSIVDNVPNMIYMRDAGGHFVLANKATAAFYNRKVSELIGMHHRDVHFVPEKTDYITEQDRKVIEEGKEVQYDLNYSDANGSERWLSVIKLPFKGGMGKTFVLGIATDTTAQKNYEQDLIRASKEVEEASKSKENFFSVMSHEIRTPLNSILGLSNLLYESQPREDQKQVMEVMRDSARHLSRLINDILDFNKNRAQKVVIDQVIFQLHNFLEQNILSFDLQCQKKGIEFRLEIAKEVPQWSVGDPARLKQILDNIIGNALRFTDEGYICLKVSRDDAGGQKAGDRWQMQLSFVDTGIGIPAESLETIFNPFQQLGSNQGSRFGGTGLGLSIVKDTVEHMGGNITVSSEVGKGTQFHVVLPMLIGEEPLSTTEAPRAEADLSNIRLLYVEDVFSNQFVLQSYCRQWNVQVEVASSGFEAIEKVRRKQFNIILMDIHMPGMDGYQTTLQVRQVPGYAEVPIIAFTADISDNVKHKIRETSMNHHLLKPVNPDLLHDLLSKLASQIRIEEGVPGNDLGFDLGFYADLVSDDFKSWEEIKEMLMDELNVFKKDAARAFGMQSYDKFREAVHRVKPMIINMQYREMLDLMEYYRNEQVFEEDDRDFLAGISEQIDRISTHMEESHLHS